MRPISNKEIKKISKELLAEGKSLFDSHGNERVKIINPTWL